MADVLRELWRAVRDAPDDMQPRLILADFLSERGDPRGVLISAQCRLAERGLSPAARRGLNNQVRKLLDKHAREWAGPALAMDASYEFRSGFMYRLSGDIERVLASWRELLATEPVVHVEVTGAQAGSVARLAASGLLGEIRHLTIRGDIADDGVCALAEADLRTIERLNLRDVGMSDAGLFGLLEASEFRPVRLTLTGNAITDAGVTALASSAVVERLERLFLSRTEVTDEGVAALAAAPGLARLRDLALGSLEELGDAGADALASSPYLTELRYVEVNACWDISRQALGRLRARFARVNGD